MDGSMAVWGDGTLYLFGNNVTFTAGATLTINRGGTLTGSGDISINPSGTVYIKGKDIIAYIDEKADSIATSLGNIWDAIGSLGSGGSEG
jgi:hypothetical protein